MQSGWCLVWGVGVGRVVELCWCIQSQRGFRRRMNNQCYFVVGRLDFQYGHGIGCFRIVCCMGPISGGGFVGDRYCRIWIVMIGQMFRLFGRESWH